MMMSNMRMIFIIIVSAMVGVIFVTTPILGFITFAVIGFLIGLFSNRIPWMIKIREYIVGVKEKHFS